MKRRARMGTSLTLAMAAFALPILGAPQTPAGSCAISGRVSAGTTMLPGVAIVAKVGTVVKAATSSDTDGTYKLIVPAGASYQLAGELTAFSTFQRTVTVAATSCDTAVDMVLTFAPKSVPPTTASGARAAGAGANGQRFQALTAQQDANAATSLEVTPPDTSVEAARSLLPPGFSTTASTESVAITGDTTSIDRGMMQDRMQAIGRGEFDPVTGAFPGQGGPGGGRGQGGPGGEGGGRGGFLIQGGGPGGPVGLGGRGGRGGSRYQFNTNYSFGGSVLDSSPYQLREGATSVKRPYARNTYGGTVGGPLKIPGLISGTRTNFTLNYSGNHSNNLFDQYATVPTAAMRGGDFSATGLTIIDPATGKPFAGNVIPASRLSAQAVALERFIPLPNLEGTSQNFHYSTTTKSTSDNISLRIQQQFTSAPAGRGGAGGRGGGPAGGARGGGPAVAGGRAGGRGQQPVRWNVSMNAQVNWRRNASDQTNVFPSLGGKSSGSSIAVPVGLNISRGRVQQTVNINYSRTTNKSNGKYANEEDIAGSAGILGVSTDPFTWGVPSLSFTTFTGVRDQAATTRSDDRLSIGYSWVRPTAKHAFRMGGEFRHDWSNSRSDSNARGSFTFTGLYSSGSAGSVPRGGYDYADFLLGMAQSASRQFGPGMVRLRNKAFSLYAQDDWRPNAKTTVSYGLRYELAPPYVETNGMMVNLDAAEGFVGVVPVLSGETGPYTGAFPAGLVATDKNNIAPRVGIAYRLGGTAVVRAGYGLSFNQGSYAQIARQLVAQPPFAVVDTATASGAPLALSNAFVNIAPSTTTNNYGIDKNYQLGLIHTWNANVTQTLFKVWTLDVGYTGTDGEHLDLLRAPNRGASGLLIPGVQAFNWQTSQGHSILHAVTITARRRQFKGLSFGGSYTLGKSQDNTTATGGGATVAQDDKNLAAEWGLSSFDRRHQINADFSYELPFGPNKPFLASGGFLASLVSDWTVSGNFSDTSGTPLTVRVTGAAADVARGTNGTLRADYNGQRIALDNPTIDQFFNTLAFSVPAAGTFGNSPRNIVIGPWSHQLNMNASRDIRMGRSHVLSLQANVSNVLNTVNWGSIDTNLNSPTFGQVLSVRGMRTATLNLRFRY